MQFLCLPNFFGSNQQFCRYIGAPESSLERPWRSKKILKRLISAYKSYTGGYTLTAKTRGRRSVSFENLLVNFVLTIFL